MLSREKMPTAITSNSHPVHKWFSFVAGYAPEYVSCVIEEYYRKNSEMPECIYDPFAGCGTTNVVANYYNIHSLGIERNPVFFKIGYAKSNAKSIYEFLPSIQKTFIATLNDSSKESYINSLSRDASTFLSKLFDIEDLNILLKLRNEVRQHTGDAYYAGYIFLSKILELTTHSKTDGIYKAPSSHKKNLSISDAILRASELFDLGNNLDVPDDNADYLFDSSVDYVLPPDSIDIVVFSPPYLNNFDFAEMTRMHMYFWEEATSWSDISTKHRNSMLINTTTALKNVRSMDVQEKMKDALPPELQVDLNEVVQELEKIRKTKPSKKEYHMLVYPYFYQMQQVLKSCFAGLRGNGEIHIVVSDAAFYGIHIDTHEFLKRLLDSVGFELTEINLMRTRGERWVLDKRKSSGKQLGEFEIVGVKRT